MNEFISIITSFPTVLFTSLLVIDLLYWMFVIFGALDLDLFDHSLDLDFDIDLDVDADVDVDADADVDGGHHLPLWVSALKILGIGQVPFMIVASAGIVFSFVFSYIVVALFGPYLVIGAGMGAAIATLSILLAYPATAISMHPLKNVFRMNRRHGGGSLIGQICVVTTGSVSGSFGQAKLEDGAAGLLLSIRTEDGQNGLSKGKKALIVSHDASKNQYWVEPYDVFEPLIETDTSFVSQTTASAEIGAKNNEGEEVSAQNGRRGAAPKNRRSA